MSGVGAGAYYITNLIWSPSGNQLAVTFTDVNAPLIVSELSNDPYQQWRVDGDGGGAIISPDSAPYVHACLVENYYVEALPKPDCTWLIFPASTADGFNIVDRESFLAWAINIPEEGEQVIVNPLSRSPLQVWRFTPV